VVRFGINYLCAVGERRLIKKIVLVTLFALIVFVPAIKAQESTSIDTLVIDLWPEYDQPSMLVIYKAELSPEISLPAEITFRIPVEAGAPAVVAVGPDAASVADVVYDTQVMGDWLDVSFIATTPAIQFEYYDPRLAKEGAQRSFDFTWPGDYTVNSLTLQVQHPLGATNVSVTPTQGRTVQDSVGFVYNIIEVGALDQDSIFDIFMSYQKESDALSVENFQIQPSATITPGTGGLLNFNQWWVWLLIGLGVVLIGGGGFWYWRMGRQEPEPKKRRRRKAPSQGAGGTDIERPIYCHQCGKRAGPGDRFCRSCGTRLRTE
jgi:hypothetical protein